MRTARLDINNSIMSDILLYLYIWCHILKLQWTEIVTDHLICIVMYIRMKWIIEKEKNESFTRRSITYIYHTNWVNLDGVSSQNLFKLIQTLIGIKRCNILCKLCLFWEVTYNAKHRLMIWIGQWCYDIYINRQWY